MREKRIQNRTRRSFDLVCSTYYRFSFSFYRSVMALGHKMLFDVLRVEVLAIIFDDDELFIYSYTECKIVKDCLFRHWFFRHRSALFGCIK